MFCIWK